MSDRKLYYQDLYQTYPFMTPPSSLFFNIFACSFQGLLLAFCLIEPIRLTNHRKTQSNMPTTHAELK